MLRRCNNQADQRRVSSGRACACFCSLGHESGVNRVTNAHGLEELYIWVGVRFRLESSEGKRIRKCNGTLHLPWHELIDCFAWGCNSSAITVIIITLPSLLLLFYGNRNHIRPCSPMRNSWSLPKTVNYLLQEQIIKMIQKLSCNVYHEEY